jgi:hypothetical protein
MKLNNYFILFVRCKQNKLKIRKIREGGWGNGLEEIRKIKAGMNRGR